jgi:hypothetical protein
MEGRIKTIVKNAKLTRPTVSKEVMNVNVSM